jgi:hypothetical protein
MQLLLHMVHKLFQYNKTVMEKNNGLFLLPLQQQKVHHEAEQFCSMGSAMVYVLLIAEEFSVHQLESDDYAVNDI